MLYDLKNPHLVEANRESGHLHRVKPFVKLILARKKEKELSLSDCPDPCHEG